jgi:tryptophan-rich sensory protein
MTQIRIDKNQKFSLNNYNELPNFKYENRILGNVWSSIFILNSISFIILIFFLRRNLKFI